MTGGRLATLAVLLTAASVCHFLPPGQGSQGGFEKFNRGETVVELLEGACVPQWVDGMLTSEDSYGQYLLADGAGKCILARPHRQKVRAEWRHTFNWYDWWSVYVTEPQVDAIAPHRLAFGRRGALVVSTMDEFVARGDRAERLPAFRTFAGEVRHCRWSNRGDLLTFSLLAPGGPQVWLTEYPSGASQHLRTLDGCVDPALSNDATRVAAVRGGDIWLHHRGSGATRRLGLTGAQWPAWSPDDRWLAFQRWQAGQWDIWAVDVHTGEARRLTSDPAWDVCPAWSRNGRWIAFGSYRKGRWSIWGHREISP